jgi:3-dehydroquinate synthetase
VTRTLTIQLDSCQYDIEIEPGLVKTSSALHSCTRNRSIYIISNPTVAEFYLQVHTISTPGRHTGVPDACLFCIFQRCFCSEHNIKKK